jgi:hypothetical protein
VVPPHTTTSDLGQRLEEHGRRVGAEDGEIVGVRLFTIVRAFDVNTSISASGFTVLTVRRAAKLATRLGRRRACAGHTAR